MSKINTFIKFIKDKVSEEDALLYLGPTYTMTEGEKKKVVKGTDISSVHHGVLRVSDVFYTGTFTWKDTETTIHLARKKE